MATEFVWDDDAFRSWVGVMVAQQSECSECHWTVNLKMVKLVNLLYILP